MAILASSIITSLRSILLDPAPGVTWADARLLALLNEGERAICFVKHEAYSTVAQVTMASGTLQTLPAGATGILDVYESATGKRRATMIEDRKRFDAINTTWPNDSAATDVNYWIADARDPTRFHVSPPQAGSNTVACLYGLTPTPIAAVGSNINLPDIYEHALKSFVMSECYAENTDRQDLTKWKAYADEWKMLVGMSSGSQVATAPKGQKA